MRKKSGFITLFIILFFCTGFIFCAIPTFERTALIALYNSTNGDNWEKNEGWKTPPLDTDGFAMPGTEEKWEGITVLNDHVIHIYLPFNKLTGKIPSELGDLTHLYRLWISNNNLTGTIPAELGELVNLKKLYLFNNQICGTIPKELGNMVNLNELILYNNQLSGTIPPELGNLVNLTYFELYSNQLKGTIPPELGNLVNLEELNLYSNKLSGSIPPELGNLVNLKELILYSNQLSGTIPPELGNLENLLHLYLNNNRLMGSIPSELGNLTKLGNLKLQDNLLGGNIPAELGNLINLRYLRLYNNQLSGNIPVELGNLTGLYLLNLKDNRLTGRIPPEIGNMGLCELILSNNKLSGSLPSELGNLTDNRLYNVDLSYNQLTGKIPDSFEKLNLGCAICNFNINYNCLFTNNTIIREWLDKYDPDWEKKQNQCEESTLPFGSFDTPIDGSTAAGSIAVSGWALDDTGIDSVKIYREEGSNLIYIGDGIFIEGARPDIAEIYPEYPNNTKAGWGYMMLTNLLPNGGNGTFKLHAIATDRIGRTKTLGIKTIICDNANAVKPFGTIDTPSQGGTASGSDYVNWGWALTPQPNSIPTDGSTISVWVDGVNLGHPTYNKYRSDIAALFPGYANTDGAAGYFSLDTTAYENGVHTIQWSVSDSSGNSEGIGSRYFTIQNTENNMTASGAVGKRGDVLGELSHIPVDKTSPLYLKTGFNRHSLPVQVYPNIEGITMIKMTQCEVLEISFFDKGTPFHQIYVYQLVGNSLKKMPAGMSIIKNTINWMPGVAYLGTYRFMVVIKDKNGELSKKFFNITIEP